MPRLVLIDGSSYLYRAFHALPPLTNAAGEPTGALFGVVNMLRATLAEKPDCAAFVVDAPGKTFRDALYPAYKANRPSMPEELRAQMQPMCEIVQALGFPILRIDGVEADDVIGTLALQALADGARVTISTSDKDFAQLVRQRDDGAAIELVNTMSGSRLDSDDAVVAKFGVHAHQIVDFLALMGDSIDNVPGVDKCGPKTAAKWLAEYGTLDGVIANAERIGGKIGENLRVALSRLPLNRELVTIKTDVELELPASALKLRERDVEALRGLYTRYGFNAALRELNGEPSPSSAGARTGVRGTEAGYARGAPAVEAGLDPALSAAGEYETVLTRGQLDAWIAKLQAAEEFAFDTETDSLNALCARIVGLSLAVEPGRACYIPLAHDYPGVPAQLPTEVVLDALRPLFADPNKRKLGQHGKYDLHVLRCHGLEVRGYADDTMLESFVFNATASRHDMDSLARRYLGYDTITYTDVAGKGAKQIAFSHVALDDATRYAAEDADVTLRLHRVLAPKLAAVPALERVYREIEIPLVPVLERIEANGVMIDMDELRRQSADLARRMLGLQQHATELAGRTFNLDSPKQVCALLFEELKLPALVKTPTGQPSANEEALEAIADQHELPRVILDYRSLAKLRSTYTDKLPDMANPDDGRVHTSYHQAGAATGRLASSDPNLQNIPIRTEDGRRIRKAFVAPAGRKIVACDYSQIELRIMAHLSEDPALLAAFHGDADIHRVTAAEIFSVAPEDVSADQRRYIKAVNFGLIYGMSAFGLAAQLNIERTAAQQFIDRYFTRYPGVAEYMRRTRELAREQGYVETVFGRRLFLPDIRAASGPRRAGAERAAINAPMQGTAADLIKLAMIAVQAWLDREGLRTRLILQVHDELVLEAPDDEVARVVRELPALMTSVATLRVPLKVDVGRGPNWEKAH
jgi:DNA polymerase-1